jgi:hypothetical protein
MLPHPPSHPLALIYTKQIAGARSERRALRREAQHSHAYSSCTQDRNGNGTLPATPKPLRIVISTYRCHPACVRRIPSPRCRPIVTICPFGVNKQKQVRVEPINVREYSVRWGVLFKLWFKLRDRSCVTKFVK